MRAIYPCPPLRPLQIQRQQPLQDLLVRQIMRPPVDIQHRLIQPLVGQVQPRGPLVVQVGQRPLLELLLAGALGVEPGVPLGHQVPRRVGDGSSWPRDLPPGSKAVAPSIGFPDAP